MSKKVLIVDDSSIVRNELASLLQDSFDIDFAVDGEDAIQKVSSNLYDVITLDINMPKLDGISVLKKVMSSFPTPVVMVSSLTKKDMSVTFDALNIGAVDFVTKPGTLDVDIEKQGKEIKRKVKAASLVDRTKLKYQNIEQKEPPKKEPLSKIKVNNTGFDKIILIGASTGGPNLIEKIATSLPKNYKYPVCVVQHMPKEFTNRFAKRLNKSSDIEVMEGRATEELTAGKMIIAKGGVHLNFTTKASGVSSLKLAFDKNDSFFIPSIDEMFMSALNTFDPKKIIAIELTGIGDDGAKGLLALKNAGAYTITESEKSATIYGMPKVAFEIGASCEVLDFDDILDKILKL